LTAGAFCAFFFPNNEKLMSRVKNFARGCTGSLHWCTAGDLSGGGMCLVGFVGMVCLDEWHGVFPC
jgi:hypothetical protein